MHGNRVLNISNLVNTNHARLVGILCNTLPHADNCIALSKRRIIAHSPRSNLTDNVICVSRSHGHSNLILNVSMGRGVSLATLHCFDHTNNDLGRTSRRRTIDSFVHLFGIGAPSVRRTVNLLSNNGRRGITVTHNLVAHPGILVLSRPAHNMSINTGGRVCRLVGRFGTSNLDVVLISSRVPRMLNVDSHVVIVRRKRLDKRFAHRRTARRILVTTTINGLGHIGRRWGGSGPSYL